MTHPSNKNVLFCYINPASGHQRAAEAVMLALRRMNPRVHAEGINSISYANPVLGRIISRLYLNILKHAPQFWEAIYDNPVIEEATRDVRELFSLFNARKTARVVKKHRPQVIVCTQAVPLNLLAALKARGKLKIPLVGIITDYGVHSYWISRAVDLYLVPSEEVRRKMIRAGIRESHVRVTGIPIDPAFLARGDGRVERARLGLDPRRPAVLVMGGGHGLGPLDGVVSSLRALPGGVQVIVVCGNNRRLLKDLQKRFSGDASVLLFGHTRQVPRLMDAADLLVSKPGGMTTSESLAKGLPMMIVKPIPGQEEWNAGYLLRHGAAERATSLEALMESVRGLLSHRDRLERMREKCLSLARPWAAFDAAESLLSLVGEPVLSGARAASAD
jgi:processive 1,2-diacylglycerol beta-glucosyltransferase